MNNPTPSHPPPNGTPKGGRQKKKGGNLTAAERRKQRENRSKKARSIKLAKDLSIVTNKLAAQIKGAKNGGKPIARSEGQSVVVEWPNGVGEDHLPSQRRIIKLWHKSLADDVERLCKSYEALSERRNKLEKAALLAAPDEQIRLEEKAAHILVERDAIWAKIQRLYYEIAAAPRVK